MADRHVGPRETPDSPSQRPGLEIADHFDLFSAELQADPYPVFDAVRTACPVFHSEAYGGYWGITRHADIVRILRDPETFSSRSPVVGPGMNRYGSGGPSTGSIVSTDPPVHATYRKLVHGPFTPAAVAARRSRCEGRDPGDPG